MTAATIFLIAAATAVAGALVLAAVRIARFDDGGDGLIGPLGTGDGLARYVTESGLRPGLILAVGLLIVPVVALGAQALRVGSVARDRRMASLRLAGATPREVRIVAAAEAGTAALTGGLASGPAYLALWLLLGVLAPAGVRLVPTPTAIDLLAWAALVPLAALGGAVAGALIDGGVVDEPLGARRRSGPSRPGRRNLAALSGGVALVIAGAILSANGGGASLVVALVGTLIAALAAGPRLVLAGGWWLMRRDGVEALLASGRLTADPRSAGRAAGVLVLCGIALGVDAGLVGSYLADRQSTDEAFYLTGFALAALGVVAAATVAVVTLVVGAADGLLDARRPLASLAALGVEEELLTRVLRLQLQVVATPCAVLGVLLGGALPVLLVISEGPSGWVVLPVLLAAALAGSAGLLAARLTARLLGSRLRAATDPENLRTA